LFVVPLGSVSSFVCRIKNVKNKLRRCRRRSRGGAYWALGPPFGKAVEREARGLSLGVIFWEPHYF